MLRAPIAGRQSAHPRTRPLINAHATIETEVSVGTLHTAFCRVLVKVDRAWADGKAVATSPPLPLPRTVGAPVGQAFRSALAPVSVAVTGSLAMAP
jgi:hypothetical protein